MHWIRDWLIPEWKHVLKRSWSVRFAVASAFFGITESVLPILGPDHLSPVPFAALSGLSAIGAVVTRIMPQSTMPQGESSKS